MTRHYTGQRPGDPSSLLVALVAEELEGEVETLLGLWMWASVEGWYGLSWRNSWPLALAAIGTGMVAKSLLTPVFHEDKAVDEEEGGHHGA